MFEKNKIYNVCDGTYIKILSDSSENGFTTRWEYIVLATINYNRKLDRLNRSPGYVGYVLKDSKYYETAKEINKLIEVLYL